MNYGELISNEPPVECFASTTPETDSETNYCDAMPDFPWVDADFARKLERERDEAREENKKLREALEWIANRYDDSRAMCQVAMDAYEMSCTARAALRKEGIE